MDKALRLQQKNGRYLRDKSRILRALERYDDALVALEAALALDPNNADLWGDKGLLLANLNRKAEAIEAYQAAIQHAAPDNLSLPLYRKIVQALTDEIRAEEAKSAAATGRNWVPAWG